MTDYLTYIFVYGSFKSTSGLPLEGIFEEGVIKEVVGVHSINAGPTSVRIGELYVIQKDRSEVLKTLDILEGYFPTLPLDQSLYIRTMLSVYTEGWARPRPAEVYIKNEER